MKALDLGLFLLIAISGAVDRAALRHEFPDVAFHDFESWAKTRDWNALLQSHRGGHRRLAPSS
jgi:hypothetical protein